MGTEDTETSISKHSLLSFSRFWKSCKPLYNQRTWDFHCSPLSRETSLNYCWYFWVVKSYPTLCNHMACSPPFSSVHGISQARILEWVAISFSSVYSWPRDQTHISCLAVNTYTCFRILVSIGTLHPPPLSVFSESQSEVAQLCTTLCDPTDCSLSGFSV